MTQSKHTPTPWKTWHSGYANAPYIIYTGDVEPFLCRRTDGKFTPEFPQGCTYIGEISSQRMHMDENENIVQHDNAAFIVKAVNNHEALFAALKSAKWMLERDFIDSQKLEIIRKCDAAIEAAAGAA